MVEFKLEGVDELMRKLTTLPDKIQKRAIRGAARKAMNLVRDAARAGAFKVNDFVSPEVIAKNIVTQESGRAGKRIGGIVMRVGVMGGAGRVRVKDKSGRGLPGGDTRHWRHVEFGTEDTAAQPFMRPALQNNIQRVTDRFMAEANAGIDKALRT